MTNPAAQKDSYLRELASHTQRTAVAPDRELAEHLELIERQLPTIVEIRDAISIAVRESAEIPS